MPPSTSTLRVPPGLAAGLPGMARSGVPNETAIDTQARLQRTKERIYVICQLGSWGSFFVLQYLYVRVFGAKASSLSEAEALAAVGRIITMGLLITHYTRGLMTRWGWKELGWRALWPRLVATGMAMGFVWCVVGYFTDFCVLGYEWKRPFSMLSGFLITWLQSGVSMIGWLCVYFTYHVFERLQRLQVEQLRLAASVKEAELRALKSQINPHFLFNSLNSLRALIDEDAPRARESVTRLANMLRYSLQSGQQETVPFEDELRTVEDYLALEQIRHENRLRVRWAIAPEARPLPIPPMLLQTLVENAVKYGISPRREGGELAITAHLDAPAAGQPGMLHLCVANPGELGAPLTASAALAGSSTGVGLRNASERLKLLYGDRAALCLLTEPPGCVTADVRIPLP